MLSPKVKSETAQQWQTICNLCKPSHRQYQVGDSFINETRPEDSYNLPFVLAYSLLDQVLSELKDAGVFSSSWMLGAKMAASRPHLPWKDYDLVNTGKEARNDLAHQGRLLGKSDCLMYIEAIWIELRAWGVI